MATILVQQLFKITTNLDFSAKWLHGLKDGTTAKYRIVKILLSQLEHPQPYKGAFCAKLLLSDGLKFVLTARFQSDAIERRFGKYRQLSGGRFLVGLKDVTWSERILKIKSLVKENIDIKDDIKVTDNEDAIQQELLDNIMEIGFENVILSDETRKLLLIFLAILLKNWSENSDAVVKIIVSMSQKQHQQLISILIFYREMDLLYHQNSL